MSLLTPLLASRRSVPAARSCCSLYELHVENLAADPSLLDGELLQSPSLSSSSDRRLRFELSPALHFRCSTSELLQLHEDEAAKRHQSGLLDVIFTWCDQWVRRVQRHYAFMLLDLDIASHGRQADTLRPLDIAYAARLASYDNTAQHTNASAAHMRRTHSTAPAQVTPLAHHHRTACSLVVVPAVLSLLADLPCLARLACLLWCAACCGVAERVGSRARHGRGAVAAVRWGDVRGGPPAATAAAAAAATERSRDPPPQPRNRARLCESHSDACNSRCGCTGSISRVPSTPPFSRVQRCPPRPPVLHPLCSAHTTRRPVACSASTSHSAAAALSPALLLLQLLLCIFPQLCITGPHQPSPSDHHSTSTSTASSATLTSTTPHAPLPRSSATSNAIHHHTHRR